MALKKDGTWDNRFRFDHKDVHDELAAMKRLAKRRAIYEKKFGKSWQQKELDEVLRENRRMKYHERPALRKNEAVIPGHRQYYIDTYGYVYHVCGRTRRKVAVPLEEYYIKRPKKSAPGGYEKQLYVALRYKDDFGGYDRNGDELIVDKPGLWYVKPHILVMHLFGPDKPKDGKGYFIDFKNGNRFAPRLSNLVWRPVSERFKRWREVIPVEVWSQRGKKISEQGRENMRNGKRKKSKQ